MAISIFQHCPSAHPSNSTVVHRKATQDPADVHVRTQISSRRFALCCGSLEQMGSSLSGGIIR